MRFELQPEATAFKLELEPNHDILAENAAVQYLDADGNVKREEVIDRAAHKVFKGTAFAEASPGQWERVGWARVYVQKDGRQPLFEGVFSVRNNHHHIELQSTYRQKRRSEDADIPHSDIDYMVVYRDSDMIRYDPGHTELKRSVDATALCHADELGFNSYPNHPIFNNAVQPRSWGSMSLDGLFGLSKRQSDTGGVSGNSGGVSLLSTINDTAGCPDMKKVALVGVAADCGFVGSFSANGSARSWIINVVNSASNVYESAFNISLALQNLTLSESTCPVTAPASALWNIPCAQANLTQRLNDFSQWRGARNDSNAYWTLVSDCNTGAEVGLSWVGQLCNNGVTQEGSDYVSGTNVVVRTQASWQVFAHESGHTFGAVHDCDAQTCALGYEQTSRCCPYSRTTCSADGRFIMNPSASADVTSFSPCTIGNVCSALGRNSVQSSCLADNRNITTITGSECGNGIVEAGEECDCGGVQNCGNDPCCDATTCKFKNGAVCDDANESCCSNCQFASSSTVCRPSSGICDIAETCTGNSGICPPNKFVADGTSCGNSSGSLTCASGQCTSRDVQCRSVMGTLLNNNDTYACDGSTCQISCASPSLGPNTCAAVNQNFLDGTPCQGNGRCSNGQCVGATVAGEIESWIGSHKTLVIGVCVAIGSLILISIFSCIVNRCRRGRAYRNGRAGNKPSSPPQPVQYGYWNNAQPAPPVPVEHYAPPMGEYSYPPPPHPPPSYPSYPAPAYGYHAGDGGMPPTRYA